MIDPRTSAEGIREYILEADIKTVVVIDVAYEKVCKAIQGTNVNTVIVVSPADSLPFMTKALYRLSKSIVIIESQHHKWNQFI